MFLSLRHYTAVTPPADIESKGECSGPDAEVLVGARWGDAASTRPPPPA